MKLNITIAAAFLTLFVSSAAQAEIICSHHGGCFETGMKILRNGGANVGLPYVNNRDMATNKAGYPQQGKRVRIIRETW